MGRTVPKAGEIRMNLSLLCLLLELWVYTVVVVVVVSVEQQYIYHWLYFCCSIYIEFLCDSGIDV